MDQSSGNVDAPFHGDWSPRISFSHSFASTQRVPSPTKKIPLHDSEFEFSRSVSTDLLTAEELFCNGKLRPLKLSSHESGKREWKASQRRQEVHIMESNMKKGAACDANVPLSIKEDPCSVCKEDAISRWDQKTQSNADEAKLVLACRQVPISVCRRAERVEIGTKAPDSTLPTSRKKCLPSVKGTAEKPEDRHATSTSPTSRNGPVSACKPEMSKKAGKSGLPTSREELISVGENTGKEKLIPPCKLEIISKAGKQDSRSTSREDLLSACSTSWMSEKGVVTPVTWKDEVLWAKKIEEDEHANLQSRRFRKHARAASMIIEGSWRLGNRSCVSLNNSRCPSPSRSFSMPSTTPASPSACSGAHSGFSSSSVSSSKKYRSKIKDFFKLRKLAVPKEEGLGPGESSSSSTCRVPVSPRSLFAFLKRRESSKAGSKSPSFAQEGARQAHENVCAIQDISAKRKDLDALPHSHINKELSMSCLTLPNSAKPPPNPSSPFHFPSSSAASAPPPMIGRAPRHSAECAVGAKLRAQKSRSLPHEKAPRAEGATMLVIDEGLWEEEGSFNRSKSALNAHPFNGHSKQGEQRPKKVERGSMMMMGGARGGGVHVGPKGLERPLPYTSSVRVTPVLNVPSCITPSLRKAKPSSKPKSFSFESLFAKKDKGLSSGNSSFG